MDGPCIPSGHTARRFIRNCKKLERILASIKIITTSFIPQRRLQLLGIDLNDLDIYSGITSPSVTRYFMPRTDTPAISQICSDASWDWFLSQKGNFCNETQLASYLLRRVFMDYQDWSIPNVSHYQLDGAISGEESDTDPVVQELDDLDNTDDDNESKSEDTSDDEEKAETKEKSGDKAKDGEPISSGEYDSSDESRDESCDEGCGESDESHEGSKESDEKDKDHHEMVVIDRLDENIRNYRTPDWLIYRFQSLFGLDIPDKLHRFGVIRSMELNLIHQCHTWALIDVNLCGDNHPSTSELLALVSWNLRGMYSQRETLVGEIEPENAPVLNYVFPTIIVTFDKQCCARVLYGYFDGRFQVQFTPILDFNEFTMVISEDLDDYLSRIDKRNYYDMMHSLLRWAWPLPHHHTAEE
ncbi:hypothetical protein N7457_008906 [Penicillium paradoxum]|uniref:uncharacterized protein n=1 Tax=Penicillium paradoxum TaxID=176176 RepID=UPI00254933FF|nr:uncharacterized protein N7457_008906 [Penicillium paradoxum]KAJ5774010.1 hypothetical protein N7457_008906 [Penicillium paradoxum]